MNTFAVVFLCVQACSVQTSIIHGTEVINNPDIGYNPGLATVPSGIALNNEYRKAAGLGYTNIAKGVPGIFSGAGEVENVFLGANTNGIKGVSSLFSNGRVSEVDPFSRPGEGNVAVAGNLPVVGKTALIGQLPISGAVKFGGNLPAAGALSVNARCTCLC